MQLSTSCPQIHCAYRLNNNTVINRNKPNRLDKLDALDELNKIDRLELLNIQDTTGNAGKTRGITIALLLLIPCLAEISCLKCCICTEDETGKFKK